MATRRNSRAPITPCPGLMRVVKKPAQAMSPNGDLLGAEQNRFTDRSLDASKSLLGDEAFGINESEAFTTTLLKYTPEGAQVKCMQGGFHVSGFSLAPALREYDSPFTVPDESKKPLTRSWKNEILLQTSGLVSGRRTRDSPIEIFDLDVSPPARRLFRRGDNLRQVILLSPSRFVRCVTEKAKQVAGPGGKRKYEALIDAKMSGKARRKKNKADEADGAKRDVVGSIVQLCWDSVLWRGRSVAHHAHRFCRDGKLGSVKNV
ncbi:hypothetical protein AC579_7567 [Pseudocercospora musae]|uniref:Uncharacterized protein n=1 Tax=Pseudocercospora musae TaxID=113226 RepID=A0A139I134_9PEZI|nr:hypothetical protein AC579_7567 [Pseudocercospora musae]